MKIDDVLNKRKMSYLIENFIVNCLMDGIFAEVLLTFLCTIASLKKKIERNYTKKSKVKKGQRTYFLVRPSLILPI